MDADVDGKFSNWDEFLIKEYVDSKDGRETVSSVVVLVVGSVVGLADDDGHWSGAGSGVACYPKKEIYE